MPARPINAKHTGTLQAATGSPSADSDLRVVHAAQSRWLPVQPLLRERAGGRHIMPAKRASQAKCASSSSGLMLTTGTFAHGQRLGDGLHRHALLVDRVVYCAGVGQW
jgi:hypothetical protein